MALGPFKTSSAIGSQLNDAAVDPFDNGSALRGGLNQTNVGLARSLFARPAQVGVFPEPRMMAAGGPVVEPGPTTIAEDTVDAKLNPDEYVIPKEVVMRKGTEFFDKLVDKARQTSMGMSPRQGSAPRPMKDGAKTFASVDDFFTNSEATRARGGMRPPVGAPAISAPTTPPNNLQAYQAESDARRMGPPKPTLLDRAVSATKTYAASDPIAQDAAALRGQGYGVVPAAGKAIVSGGMRGLAEAVKPLAPAADYLFATPSSAKPATPAPAPAANALPSYGEYYDRASSLSPGPANPLTDPRAASMQRVMDQANVPHETSTPVEAGGMRPKNILGGDVQPQDGYGSYTYTRPDGSKVDILPWNRDDPASLAHTLTAEQFNDYQAGRLGFGGANQQRIANEGDRYKADVLGQAQVYDANAKYRVGMRRNAIDEVKNEVDAANIQAQTNRAANEQARLTYETLFGKPDRDGNWTGALIDQNEDAAVSSLRGIAKMAGVPSWRELVYDNGVLYDTSGAAYDPLELINSAYRR